MSSVQFHDMNGSAAHIIEMNGPKPLTANPDRSIASDAAHPDVQTPPVPLPAGTSTRDLNSAKATTLSISAFKTPKNNLVMIIKAGLAKTQLSMLHIFLLGIMAGMYVSIGGAVMTIITGGLSDDQVWSSSSSTIALYSVTNHSITTTTITTTHYNLPSGFQRLIQASVFPLGLIPVILAGGELFTSVQSHIISCNNVMFGLAAWYARKATWRQMLRLWGVSYLSNFIGCVFFGFLLVYLTDLTSPNPIKSWLQNLVFSKTHQGWGVMVLKGIGCNILVCLAVWQALVADDVAGKIVGIWWPIFGFVAIGFEHSVANMFLAPLALMTGSDVNFGDFLAWNLIPVTVGNMIGGGFLITIQWVVFQEHLQQQIDPLTVKAGYKAPSHYNLAWLWHTMHEHPPTYTQPQPQPPPQPPRETTKVL